MLTTEELIDDDDLTAIQCALTGQNKVKRTVETHRGAVEMEKKIRFCK